MDGNSGLDGESLLVEREVCVFDGKRFSDAETLERDFSWRGRIFLME